MSRLYIDYNKEIMRIAVVENDRLSEYIVEETSKENFIGNIYRGRVESVIRGINSCFVNIGLEKNAYMSIDDATDNIKAGEHVIVQVIKEPIGTKGAVVTTNISLPARTIVLTPFVDKISVSRNIEEKCVRKRLKELLKENSKGYGVIARTQAKYISEEVLLKELDQLILTYSKIKAETGFLPTPKLIYSDNAVAKRVSREMYSCDVEKIVVNDKSIYNDLKNEILDDRVKANGVIEFDEDYNMDYHMPIQLDLKEALSRRVDLVSGGYLIIEETEALTVIDVNSGSFVNAINQGETILRTNIEASCEIARQIKLRDIGGIIIIDLIDMANKEHKEIVLEHLETSFKKDKSKPKILSITRLGLVEVVRKKRAETLSKKTSTVCPTCGGLGRIRENNS